uniref:Putative lipocalin lipocalin n=1 Tax=Rhipicephalus microplus TaxID=6941 RepID=A0A6G5A5M5_RHIMP
MAKFLNTSDPIWSYMTTSNMRRYDCKVDVTDDMHDEDVLFRRFFGYRRVIISDWMLFLHGHLYQKSTRYRATTAIYNAMKVSFREQGTPLDTETLLFQDMNNTCGIVEVGDMASAGQGLTYELRVKNSSIEAPNQTDCFKEYQKMVKKAKVTVTYLPACQNILIGMNNIIAGGSPDNGAIGLLYFISWI